MSNSVKVIIGAVAVTAVVTLLFLLVPVTPTFVICYIFALAAIAAVAAGLMLYDKGPAPHGYARIYAAVAYCAVSILFSVIACALSLDALITFFVHAAVLVLFFLIAIGVSAGNAHITKAEKQAEEKRRDFESEKKNYWK